jgi:hypothetical protein
VVEKNIDVVIACDPYEITDGLGGWLTSSGTKRVAIKVFGNNATIAKIETDDEYVLVRVDGVYIYSCYTLPNTTIAGYREFLRRLERSAQLLERQEKIIIAGDLNTRSTVWGDWQSNTRGDELLELSEGLSMVIINKGKEPTFHGNGKGSIVDITFASEALSATSGTGRY